jgi:hypothetical protein
MKSPRIAERPAWYTRRDGKVRGPYSTSHVTRYILLGRIRLTDELSDDRDSWRPLAECSECLPDAFIRLPGPDDYQRLVIARILVEERRSQRRQDDSNPVPPAGMIERRSGFGRRQADNNTESPASHLMENGDAPGKQRRSSPLRAYLLTTLLVTLIVAGFSAAFR